MTGGKFRGLDRGSRVSVGGREYRCYGAPKREAGVRLAWQGLCPKCSRSWRFDTPTIPKSPDFPKYCPDCAKSEQRKRMAKRNRTVAARRKRGEYTERERARFFGEE